MGNPERQVLAVSELSASGGLFWGKPAYVARTAWGPWLAVVATLAVLGTALVAAGVLAGLRPGTQNLELVVLGVWQGLVVLLTLALVAFRGGARDVLALGRPRGAPGVYLAAVLLLMLLNAAVSVVQYLTFPQYMYTDLRPFVGFMTGPDWLLALLVVGIGAPLSEELLFRGFLLSALAGTRFGFLGAALISTALWTSLHASYTLLGIVEVFLIGLFFCWLLWRTGSLWVAIFCHALYNSLIVVVLRYVPLPA
jgi:membrane protease YdiL (CAAX protease family)